MKNALRILALVALASSAAHANPSPLKTGDVNATGNVTATGAVKQASTQQVFSVAGSGLTSSGSTVALNISGGASQSCGSGNAVTALSALGIITCGPAGFGGTITTGDLLVATSPSAIGNYAGSSPAPCGAGTVETATAISAVGGLSYTCSSLSTIGAASGAGTLNQIVKWSNATGGLTNAWPSDNGTTWGVAGKFAITEATGSTAIGGLVTANAGVTSIAGVNTLGEVIVEGANANTPPSNLAALELFTGRSLSGGLVNANQTVADVAFDYGGGGGGFRHWISTEHDTTPANNKIRFWVNSSGTAVGSSQPGTGNTEALRLLGDGSVIALGALTASNGLTSTAAANTLGTTTFSGPITSTGSSTSAIREQYFGTDTQGTTDNANGPAWRLGINSSGRRSIMLIDSAASTLNSTNTALDLTVGATQGAEINAVSTGWTAAQPLSLNGSSVIVLPPATLQGAITATGNTFTAGSSTKNFQFIDSDGSARPTVSACGTSPSVVGNDTSGTITVGTGGGSSCTLTFHTAFAVTPTCIMDLPSTATKGTYTTSTTALVYTAALGAGQKVVYICRGH